MGNGTVCEPLIETKTAKRLAVHRLYTASVFTAICLIWGYGASHVPREEEEEEEEGEGRWVWVATFVAELWFGFYWFLSQFIRWNLIYRRPFKDGLSQRIKDENEFPGVDVFVCTADPAIEPPMVVINTVLSVMAYDYPPEKLCVYLSDDAASIITFYALFEASRFAKHWIQFCKKLNAEPTSPAAYFAPMSDSHEIKEPVNLATIKKLYEEMESRIEAAATLGRLPEEVQLKHKGFSLWGSDFSRHNHDTIIQVELHGMDACGGPPYVGTGCFFRRDILCGKRIIGDSRFDLNPEHDRNRIENLHELEEVSRRLASCTYEENTPWGKEMGVMYGLAENIITGLSVQFRGWRSVYFNPKKKAFLGLGPATLSQRLMQQKRWAEGDFQIMFS